MDATTFDRLAIRLSRQVNRRHTLRTVAVTASGLIAGLGRSVRAQQPGPVDGATLGGPCTDASECAQVHACNIPGQVLCALITVLSTMVGSHVVCQKAAGVSMRPAVAPGWSVRAGATTYVVRAPVNSQPGSLGAGNVPPTSPRSWPSSPRVRPTPSRVPGARAHPPSSPCRHTVPGRHYHRNPRGAPRTPARTRFRSNTPRMDRSTATGMTRNWPAIPRIHRNAHAIVPNGIADHWSSSPAPPIVKRCCPPLGH